MRSGNATFVLCHCRPTFRIVLNKNYWTLTNIKSGVWLATSCWKSDESNHLMSNYWIPISLWNGDCCRYRTSLDASMRLRRIFVAAGLIKFNNLRLRYTRKLKKDQLRICDDTTENSLDKTKRHGMVLDICCPVFITTTWLKHLGDASIGRTFDFSS